MSADLSAYREEQRRKYERSILPAQDVEAPVLVAESQPLQQVASAESDSNIVSSQEPANAPLSLTKIHLLPIETDLSESARLDAVVAILSQHKSEPMQTGRIFTRGADRFVIAKAEPENGILTGDTDFFVSGPPVIELTKIQLVALLGENVDQAEQVSDALFQNSVGPYLESQLGENCGLVVHQNLVIVMGETRYIAAALEPVSSSLTLLTRNTLVFVDAECSGDFARIHVLPFQDTLPRVYDFDVFEDYLKPYFSNNPGTLYSVNTQFVFRGVQFKVVSVDPADGRPRRVSPRTLIHCDGLLHASLRNMLPPELLEQLSSLPPGLQMLLINTELLGSVDVLDRFIDLQETLASRRGVSEETLNAISVEQFDPSAIDPVNRPESTVQCMICLSEFEAGESLRRLPCAHVYHQPCIDEWLRRCTDCPLCKTNIEHAIRGHS